MSSRRVFTLVGLAAWSLAGCEQLTGGGSGGGPKVAESGTAKGSAGGFAATMSGELQRAGVGEPTIVPPAAPPPAAAGSGGTAAGGSAKSASGSTTSGATASDSAASGQTKSASASGTGSTSGTGSASTSGTGPASTSGTGSASASGSSSASGTGSASASASGSSSASGATGSASKSVTSTAIGDLPKTDDQKAAAKATGAVKAPTSRPYAKPSADVAAIKLDLEPNWERDMGKAGTFSLVVKVTPGSDDTRLFSVDYGYEDQSAPIDCDAYKKFLEDKSMMHVTLNRQRGAACYIEGTDQGGTMAFRFLLNYGGKRLMCHGSLYKDPASAALGDLRDKVLVQAKKICETLAL